MKKIDVKESIVYKFDSKEDLSQAVLALSEKGYFSDDKDFSAYEYGRLYEVRCWLTSCNQPFVLKDDEGNYNSYKYFITEESVVFKKQKPKYRPYKNLAEFANSMGLRDSDKVQFIGFRSKHSTSRYDLVYNGYEIDTFGTVYIHLGSMAFTLNELFNNYEYELNSFEWLPFGVEENEED